MEDGALGEWGVGSLGALGGRGGEAVEREADGNKEIKVTAERGSVSGVFPAAQARLYPNVRALGVYVHAHAHACMHAYIHTHTHAHTRVRACMRAYPNTHIHTGVVVVSPGAATFCGDISLPQAAEPSSPVPPRDFVYEL